MSDQLGPDLDRLAKMEERLAKLEEILECEPDEPKSANLATCIIWLRRLEAQLSDLGDQLTNLEGEMDLILDGVREILKHNQTD